MLDRQIYSAVTDALARQAAVALIGPRQVGKTTLALALGEKLNAVISIWKIEMTATA